METHKESYETTTLTNFFIGEDVMQVDVVEEHSILYSGEEDLSVGTKRYSANRIGFDKWLVYYSEEDEWDGVEYDNEEFRTIELLNAIKDMESRETNKFYVTIHYRDD